MWVLACLGVLFFVVMGVRLRVIEMKAGEQTQAHYSFKEKKIRLLEAWIAFHLLPPMYENWLKKRLLAAGKPGGWKPQTIFLRQLFLGVLLLMLGFILPLQGGVWIPVFFGGLGFVLPLLKLQKPIRDREKEVRKTVRQWLILLIPLLEGELHFQTTMFDIFHRTKGVLQEDAAHIMVQVSGGRSLRNALWDIARKVQVREFSQLVRVLADGDRYGPQEMAAKLRELKIRMDREFRRKAKKEIRDVMIRLFFVVLLFIFVPMLILGFVIMLQSMKQNIPL